jgi:hypothetical protein
MSKVLFYKRWMLTFLLLAAASAPLASATPQAVRLVIEQEYGEAKEFSLPLERLAKEALAGVGLETASNASETLLIRLRGTPYKGYDVHNIAHYIGAAIEGEILVQGNPANPQSVFQGERNPTNVFVTATMYIHPEDAPFTRALVDSDFFTALSRVVVAAWGGSPTAALLGVLKDPDDLYQQAAARALGELKDPAAAGRLLEVLKLPSTRNRAGLQWALVEALGSIRDAASADTLLALLTDPKAGEKTRELAAKALGKIGDRRAAVPLATVLDKDLDWHFQEEIFTALIALGDRRAIGPLALQLVERNKRKPMWNKTLESFEQDYDKRIADTLRKLSGQDFGLDGSRWVAWWKQNQ